MRLLHTMIIMNLLDFVHSKTGPASHAVIWAYLYKIMKPSLKPPFLLKIYNNCPKNVSLPNLWIYLPICFCFYSILNSLTHFWQYFVHWLFIDLIEILTRDHSWTIHILPQQRIGWLEKCQFWLTFNNICNYSDFTPSGSGWVRKCPKMCWRNIWMVSWQIFHEAHQCTQ